MKINKALLFLVMLIFIFLLCSCNTDTTPVTKTTQSPTSQSSIDIIEEKETETTMSVAEKKETETTMSVAEKKEKETETTVSVTEKTDNKNFPKEEDLFGFWHCAPEFTKGIQSHYIFHDDGGVYNESEEHNIYYGEWNISTDGVLAVTPYKYEYENKIPAKNYNIDYIDNDVATGGPSIMIDNRKFWKLHQPQDVINGVGFYVDYYDDYYKENANLNKKIINLKGSSERDEHIVIYYEGDMFDFKICSLGYDEKFNGNFYLEDVLFSVDEVPSDYVIEYNTILPEGMPFEAISFNDSNKNHYSYILGYNGRDGLPYAYRADIIDYSEEGTSPPNSDSSEIKKYDKKRLADLKTLNVKFYWYDDVPDDYHDEKEMKSKTEQISGENLLEETIRLMELYNGLKIEDIWYEGTKICVSLKKLEKMEFDKGSTAGIMHTNELLMTFASFPDVEEIEVLFEGEKGVFGDHFDFSRILKVKGRTLKEINGEL